MNGYPGSIFGHRYPFINGYPGILLICLVLCKPSNPAVFQ